jgi:hypothetical protein
VETKPKSFEICEIFETDARLYIPRGSQCHGVI